MLHDDVQPRPPPINDSVVVAHDEGVPQLSEDVHLFFPGHQRGIKKKLNARSNFIEMQRRSFFGICHRRESRRVAPFHGPELLRCTLSFFRVKRIWNDNHYHLHVFVVATFTSSSGLGVARELSVGFLFSCTTTVAWVALRQSIVKKTGCCWWYH